MVNRVLYSTLALAKVELKANENADDSVLLDYIEKVSVRVDELMSTTPLPYFAPYVKQERKPLDRMRFKEGGRVYDMLFPLQEVTEVLLEATDYTASVEIDYENQGHLRWIASELGFTKLLNDNTAAMRLKITGTWGFSRDYSTAWQASGDAVVDNPLSIGATTIEVADSSLFAAGQLIQMQSEWALVTALLDATHLTVKRGVHGTTPTAQPFDTPIDVFQVDDLVQRLVARQAALWYARRGAFQQQSFDGVGVVSYPPDLLTELENSLREIIHVR